MVRICYDTKTISSWLCVVRISVAPTWILIGDQLFSSRPSVCGHHAATVRTEVTYVSVTDLISVLRHNSTYTGSSHSGWICHLRGAPPVCCVPRNTAVPPTASAKRKTTPPITDITIIVSVDDPSPGDGVTPKTQSHTILPIWLTFDFKSFN